MKKKNFLLLGLFLSAGFSVKSEPLETLQGLNKFSIDAPLTWTEAGAVYGLPAVGAGLGLALSHMSTQTGPFSLNTWTAGANYRNKRAPIAALSGFAATWALVRMAFSPVAWKAEAAKTELARVLSPGDFNVLNELLILKQASPDNARPLVRQLEAASFSFKGESSDPFIELGEVVRALEERSDELQEALKVLDQRGSGKAGQLSVALQREIGLLQALRKGIERTSEYAASKRLFDEEHAAKQRRLASEAAAQSAAARARTDAANASVAKAKAFAESVSKAAQAAQEVRTAFTGRKMADQNDINIKYDETKKTQPTN